MSHLMIAGRTGDARARAVHVHQRDEGFVLPSLVKRVFAIDETHGVKAGLQLEAVLLELVLVREEGADGLAVDLDVHEGKKR